MEEKYVKLSEIVFALGFSYKQLMTWAESGKFPVPLLKKKEVWYINSKDYERLATKIDDIRYYDKPNFYVPKLDSYKEGERIKNKESRHKNVEKRLYEQAKARAREKNIEFTIEIQDITVPKKCPLLGINLVFDNSSIKDNSPSLDRKDNLLGYTKENIWVISTKANVMKNDASPKRLRTFARGILRYF